MTLLRGRLIVVGAVLIVLAGLGVGAAVLHSPAPSLGTRGVDVSSHEHAGNAAINWPDVAAAGDSFAAIKVSEGTYYDNPFYASDAVQAARAGLFVMPYIFADPFDAKDNGSAAQQVDMAARQLGTVAVPASQMLPLALDIEPDPYAARQKVNECYGLSPAAMVTWIGQFMAEAQLKTGRKPVIYTSTAWWKACTGDSAAFGSYPLWIMSWSPSAPTLPAGWNTYTFWQQTARGAVPGIAGSHTDEDYLARPVSLQPSRLAWTLTVVGCVLCPRCGAEHPCDLGARARKVAAGRASGRPGDGQVHGEIEPVEQPRHLGIVAGAVNDVTEQLQTPRTHRFLASWRFQGRRELGARPHRDGIFPKQDGLKQNGSVMVRLGR